MQAPAVRQTNPFVIMAAVALTLFSVVGIGAILGWIPTSIGSGEVKTAAAEPAKPEGNAPVAPAEAPAAEAPKPAAPKRAVKPKHRAVAASEPPLQVARAEPAPAAVPPPPVAAAACRECAVIEEIREVERDGDAKGGGAITGGVLGGVVGHRFGSGRGNDLATVIGAVGGAVAGHQIEKNANKTKEYQISVRYEDGSRGLFTQSTPPSWRPGDKVRIVNDTIVERG